jgi:hypothetical protein
MASDDYDFQKELENAIINCDPKLNKKDLLEDIFKSYVAKSIEWAISKRHDNRLELSGMKIIQANLISEFRKAELSEYQQSLEWYEHKFDEAIREITSLAANNHEGVDNIQLAEQKLDINMEAYKHEGGLYIPKSPCMP